MKWDVKHDRAKRIINAFLENAGYWQEREDLAEGLTEEEKELVSEELALMITSIRKRYKLQERLTEQKAELKMVENVAEEKKETEAMTADLEQVQESSGIKSDKPTEEPKPKRRRKAAETEKKLAANSGGKKKEA